MSEIEKLYINANVEKEWMPLPYGGIDEFYPEFTAEKQLELIKWLAITRAILIKQNRMFVGFETGNSKDLKCAEDLDLNFEETLAKLINHLWQNLTATEKAEIKRILE
jgi:hypothetical protein